MPEEILGQLLTLGLEIMWKPCCPDEKLRCFSWHKPAQRCHSQVLECRLIDCGQSSRKQAEQEEVLACDWGLYFSGSFISSHFLLAGIRYTIQPTYKPLSDGHLLLALKASPKVSRCPIQYCRCLSPMGLCTLLFFRCE